MGLFTSKTNELLIVLKYSVDTATDVDLEGYFSDAKNPADLNEVFTRLIGEQQKSDPLLLDAVDSLALDPRNIQRVLSARERMGGEIAHDTYELLCSLILNTAKKIDHILRNEPQPIVGKSELKKLSDTVNFIHFAMAGSKKADELKDLTDIIISRYEEEYNIIVDNDSIRSKLAILQATPISYKNAPEIRTAAYKMDEMVRKSTGLDRKRKLYESDQDRPEHGESLETRVMRLNKVREPFTHAFELPPDRPVVNNKKPEPQKAGKVSKRILDRMEKDSNARMEEKWRAESHKNDPDDPLATPPPTKPPRVR